MPEFYFPAAAVIVSSFLTVAACAEHDEPEAATLRIATFNIAMGLENQGEMAAALQSGQDERLKSVAKILQTVRPHIVLLNEFDYDETVQSARLLNTNYLAQGEDGLEPVEYPFSFQPAVNTGVDSGLDLDGNGKLGDPGDAWGFGNFPGQYGMLLLSKFPIKTAAIRTFQQFPWSDFPGAKRPMQSEEKPFHPDPVWSQMRLSSKTHADVPVLVGPLTLHLLISHPTPPIFDGPENRNGRRNFDEIGLWAHYIDKPDAGWIRDDNGATGGLDDDSLFVIMGDLNADPHDGDSIPGSIDQLLSNSDVNSRCTPASTGAAEAAEEQGGVNTNHQGNPAHDTSDFNDEFTGNLRLDYVLPSGSLKVSDCSVFWPDSTEPNARLVEYSDHRLVWIDLALEGSAGQ